MALPLRGVAFGIDHINHVRHDNRIINLRNVPQQDNQKNQRKHKDNKSGVMGVCWDNSRRKWKARINVNGCEKWLGRFAEFNDEVSARESAMVKYGFHKNHGN